LIDFKVHLEKPLEKMIPHFFNEKEYKTMEDYFIRAFGKHGLFYNKLILNNQYENIISHVLDTCLNIKERFATRRAILVIPNDSFSPISPLGLISIRIITRFERETIKLNFSFTWRTVEAVKGFPYSLYGSVKFSEQIMNDIKERITDKSQLINIEIDTLSYIAHSLHMFTDTYSQEIIRGIINDASK